MPEIKHSFQGGKMNKDLDERLVPNGEYRHAENVQVRTSDGDAIGTIQNIKSDLHVGNAYYADWMADDLSRVVASVADEKSDKAYFLIASPQYIWDDSISSERMYIDSIVEQDVDGTLEPVVVDIHTIINTKFEVLDQAAYNPINYTNPWTQFEVLDGSKYRVGMTIKALASTGEDLFVTYVTQGGTITSTQNGNGAKIKAINGNIITLHEEQTTDLELVEWFEFTADPVLNFHGNQITGINIIDDLLFWTDNISEPKKINITRCKEGTVNISTHTKLFVHHPLTLEEAGSEQYVEVDDIVDSMDGYFINTDLREEHITVMRRAPRTAPTLRMANTLRADNIEVQVLWAAMDGDEINSINQGDTRIITDPVLSNTDFRPNDILTLTQIVETELPGSIRVKFEGYLDDLDGDGIPETVVPYTTNSIQVVVMSVSGTIPVGEILWQVILLQVKPLFELKLPRFGYRYKYEDGEYSSFSPWSELAFMPGEFDMVIKKAYNLGMVNSLRELIIKDFIPYKKPLDVIEVDILYKVAGEPNVYVVQTIKRGKDDEWELHTPGGVNPDVIKTGELEITSEMIHRVLPASQTLRAWDNVPRKALAQEIVGSRLLYGNYTQGYPMSTPVSLQQLVENELTPSLVAPQKSIKSIRSYRVGMVFGDKYGRETPVIESSYSLENSGSFSSSTTDQVVEKKEAPFANRFKLTQQWESNIVPNGEPPDWIDYVKYYIKETSNEYYNLIMDRWYWADEERDNVWISFNSADRNKVDEETYLLLKNQHGSHVPVEERARFRIIAIENDAPDYIKTVGRGIGTIALYPLNTVGTIWSSGTGAIPSSTPTSLVSGTSCEILIHQSVAMQDNPAGPIMGWNGSISGWGINADGDAEITDFSNQVFGRRIDGNIRMRVVGKNTAGNILYSDWRNLYHYRFIDVAENADMTMQKIELNWDSVWGDEADMYARFVNANYGVVGLTVSFQFEEEKVTNKPEFDGKYFVKIERNYELDVHVLYAMGDSFLFDLVRNGLYRWLDNGQLGNCTDNIYTRDFWSAWAYAADGANTLTDSNIPLVGDSIFFDSARARYMRFLNVPTVGGGTEIVGGDFHKPEALEQGTATIGMGRMHLSKIIASVSLSNVSGSNQNTTLDDDLYTNMGATNMIGIGNSTEILTALSIPGTKFRFTNDTTVPQQIYQVINAERAVGTEDGTGQNGEFVRNYGGVEAVSNPILTGTGVPIPTFLEQVVDAEDNYSGTNPLVDGASCVKCGDSNDASSGYGPCFRWTIRVDFRLLDSINNNLEGDTGVIVSDWSPLTGLIPTGGIGNIVGSGVDTEQPLIEIIKPGAGGNAATKVELGGCWETEPKDDSNLEIYYEASNAIPMKLTEYNSFDFSPINSTVTLRRQDGSGTNDVPMTYTDHKVANIHFTNDSPIVYITSLNEFGTLQSHVYDIALDDFLVFTHSDGTQTQAKVVGNYIPNETPVTGSTSFDPVIFLYPELIYTFDPPNSYFTLTDTTNVEVGMYLSSPGQNVVPVGTIITSINEETGVITTSNVGTGAAAYQLWNFNNQSPTGNPVMITNQAGWYELEKETYKQPVKLGWFNCYSFGNGVESDRIRDDYNAPQIDNGVRVSTTFSGYKEEKMGSGLIYSGLYNSTSEVNNLNEFNMAEKITKNLNPSYGSIQALKTRDTDVVVLTEDKVLKVLSNKDAVFNADGDPRLIASNRVLGTAVPFVGDYGISKNPESLAWDQYRMYFTDRQRGAVLRLSRDGLTPISNVGMKTWFRNNLRLCNLIYGSFDAINGEYNLTLNYKEQEEIIDGKPHVVYNAATVSFNEGAKGWVSFKSFIPQAAVSVSGNYLTAINHKIYKSFGGADYNNFYGQAYESTFKVVFNEMPGSVKSFKSINYEGSQARISEFQTGSGTNWATGNQMTFNDGEYYNLQSKNGWWVDSFETDMQSGRVVEFKSKENKWFNKITGIATTLQNLDTSEFTVQGIGLPNNNAIISDVEAPVIHFIVQNNTDDSQAVIDTNSDGITINSNSSTTGITEG